MRNLGAKMPNDSPHLTLLRQSLAQCEEGARLVHSDHNREVLTQDAADLKKDIERLEKWEAKQNGFVKSEDANGKRRKATGTE